MKTSALFLSCTLILTACGGDGTGTNPFMEAANKNNQNTLTPAANGTDTGSTTGANGDGGDTTSGTGDGTQTSGQGTTNGSSGDGGDLTPGTGVGTGEVITSTGGTPTSGQGSGSQSGLNMVLVLSDGEVENPRFFTETDDNGDIVEKLYVDNIPFDGVDELAYVSIANIGIGTSNGVGLFQAVGEVKDSVTGVVIGQIFHRALYGKNETGSADFVIVKSRDYITEGFGGYVVQRNKLDLAGNLVEFERPDIGQAVFYGSYDGFRIVTDNPGMYHTSGDVEIIFDFGDSNKDGDLAFLSQNREMYDQTGQLIRELPDLSTVIGSGKLTTTGQMDVEIFSLDAEGEEYETGTMTGILAGKIPMEAAGVISLTSSDDDASYQETGGFFAYRRAKP